MACEKQIVFKKDEDGLWATEEIEIEPQEDESVQRDKKGETKPGNGKNQRRKHRGGQRDH